MGATEIQHDYEPDPFNPHNERWVEFFTHDDGSVEVRRSHPLVSDEVEHSELLHQIETRLAEVGCEEPSFLERLRRAEIELAPIQDEALAWLDEVGPPALLTDGRVWDDEDDWKAERW